MTTLKSDRFLESLRNLGIIAHIDAGKTTLTERILFYSNRIHRMGEVHDGNATMDFMPEEQQRGITIGSACTTVAWKGVTLNIIDTPGHVDFTVEVDRALRVLDGVVGVFCAVGGVEPQSETVWRQSEKYHIPKLAFINKIDRPGADFEGVLDSMREKLGVEPLVMQIPLGEGADFTGVVDVLQMEKLIFSSSSRGAEFERLPLDERELARVRPWHNRVLETLADHDEEIFEAYLEGKEVSPDHLRSVIRQGTIGLKFVPVFCGSALRNIGVQPLLDGVVSYLPSPLEVPAAEGVDPVSRQKKRFDVAPGAPLSALAFKVFMEKGRKQVLLRIYSGTLREGDSVYNATQGCTERVARLYRPHAGHKEKIEQGTAGQIVVVVGLKQTRTADTLCSADDALLLERISEYRPVLTLALEAKNSEEEERLESALEKLLQEDPTLLSERNVDTEQIMLSGMGELHLEVVLDRLLREYHVPVRAGQPQVVYQETIRTGAAGAGEFRRTLGDDLHFGWVSLEVEPGKRGKGNEIIMEVDREQWAPSLVEGVYDGIVDALQAGVIGGHPVLDVRVRVKGLRDPGHEGTVLGFRMAAVNALKNILPDAEPALLEPLMWVQVFAPDEFVGESISLLGARGAKIENMFDSGGRKIIQALTPLRQLFGFSTALRSATQGRAGMTMRFERFDVLE